MRVGIDVSQTAYLQTGVSNYLTNLLMYMIKHDKRNEYVLFFSSRRTLPPTIESLRSYQNVIIKSFPFPVRVLAFLWNRLHILPIELFIGSVDVFISSDWTQPPTKAKRVTILYDLIVYTYPQEMDSRIVSTQKRRMHWVKKECDKIFCISEATRKDAKDILGIEEKRLEVIYPGV